MYVRVCVLLPQMSGEYDYHLSAELEGLVRVGCLVVVPFGRRMVQAVVLSLLEKPSVAETKPVSHLVDPLPAVTAAQMALAQRMAYQYLTPLSVCIQWILPAGLSQNADTAYRLNPHPPVDDHPLSPLQERLVRHLVLHEGEQRGRQLESSFSRTGWRTAIAALVKRGRVLAQPVLPPPQARPKQARFAELAVEDEALPADGSALGRGAVGERRLAILNFLKNEGQPVQAAWLYAVSGGNLADLQRLEAQGWIHLVEKEVMRDPLEAAQAGISQPKALTAQQQAVWQPLQAALRAAAQEGRTPPPFVLHGVTGSGKTEVYLYAVAECLRLGRQAIVMVPEIALTPQTVQRFLSRFPQQVGILHSRLSVGERYDTWRRARAGQLSVIVGPRSALFAPLPDVGLIVVDECHEDSYYQAESPPYYHTVEAAQFYAQAARAVVVLGSATPDVAMLYQAQKSGWPVLALTERIHDQEDAAAPLSLPPVDIVDMRSELKHGNRSIFSQALQQALAHTLEAGEQAILYLNRRGAATYVFCRDCGHVLRCPRCDLPLTYHLGSGGLHCHTCNYRRRLPSQCPQCGSPNIRHYGSGTERVEAEVNALFPQARTLRWDAETARGKQGHQTLMEKFSAHQADILIGTQMLAKGLDLPLVTLVGVVLADVGLSFPDYRAGERAFQLLTQVAGRAGRSHLGGRVIFQTFMPEHYVIQAAAGHDYAAFYAQELARRREMGYPPFAHLARVEVRGQNAQSTERAAQQAAVQLGRWAEEAGMVELIGPSPCFFHKVNGMYRWQILLRGQNVGEVLRGKPLGEWRVQLDPPNVL
ncbi:replication restart helicase PriA [Levilinea saccharolytica]|nr:primosomal protein N' [Levilinea saccharolytica]GAP19250.1 replication restart DNA helicase PriA [Levilinea saccharolytica]